MSGCPPPDRTAVPHRDGTLAGPLLSGDQARPRPASPHPVIHAGGRSGGRLRLRLGVAFLEMLPRTLFALAATGAAGSQAAAGSLIPPLKRAVKAAPTADPTSSFGPARVFADHAVVGRRRCASTTGASSAASASQAGESGPASSSTSLRLIASGNCDQSLTGIMKAPGPPMTQSA